MGLKILYAIVNIFFIIAWIIASAYNKASIGELDLDPEDLEDSSDEDD